MLVSGVQQSDSVTYNINILYIIYITPNGKESEKRMYIIYT